MTVERRPKYRTRVLFQSFTRGHCLFATVYSLNCELLFPPPTSQHGSCVVGSFIAYVGSANINFPALNNSERLHSVLS